MFRQILALAIAAFLFGTAGLHADEKKNWTSPSGGLVARAKNHKAAGSADYTDWDVVTIYNRAGKILASLSLEEGSGINRAVVTEAIWSPDSRFFAFQTTSSGGHSVWHAPVYVYDAKTSRIYSIDDTIGSVTSDNSPLHFAHGDVLHVELWNSKWENDSDPTFFPRDIPLPDFVKTAKVALDSKRLRLP
jgi:hypothetical protein